MKTLSIQQPWASLICTPRIDNPSLGIKDIENRTWRTKYRGKLLIHAGAKPWTWHAVINYLTDEMKEVFEKNRFDGKWVDVLSISAIIGEVTLVDCIINHPSIWAEKTWRSSEIDYNENSFIIEDEYPHKIWNWVLENPVLYDEPILNVKGKLSLWEYEK